MEWTKKAKAFFISFWADISKYVTIAVAVIGVIVGILILSGGTRSPKDEFKEKVAVAKEKNKEIKEKAQEVATRATIVTDNVTDVIDTVTDNKTDRDNRADGIFGGDRYA